MNNSVEADKSLDILREEYVRLSTRCDALVDGAFTDFKLLAAIGALIAWPPFATSDMIHTTDASLTLLVGFIGILFLITIIAVRDLLKWVIIGFYMQEMRVYESEIRTHLASDVQAFHFAHNWPKYTREWYIPVYSRFALLFVLVLILLPTGVLYLRADYSYMVIYLICFAVATGIYVWAVRKTTNTA